MSDSPTVLVVEDESALAMAHARILRGQRFRVHIAGDALAAVTIARREEPDLVLLDLGLPAGGGMSVLDRLRSLSATVATPVVVVTGQGISPGLERAVENGSVHRVLAKPVSAAELLDAVAAALGPRD